MNTHYDELYASQDSDRCSELGDYLHSFLTARGIDVDAIEVTTDGEEFSVSVWPFPAIRVCRDKPAGMAWEWAQNAQGLLDYCPEKLNSKAGA